MIPPRPAVRSDLDPILDLLVVLNARGTALEPRYRLMPGARPLLRDHLRDAWFGSFLPFPACWVVDDGGPVGVISGLATRPHPILERPPVAMIDNLFVAASHRGKGHGRRLVEAFHSAAQGAGFPELDVGTLAADHEAVAFWRAMGFTDRQVILSRN